MGLSQSITIMNEYTVKTPGGGSRGGTIGRFITDYLCREEAVEPLYTTHIDLQTAKDAMMPKFKRKKHHKADRLQGVAFSDRYASLSGKEVEQIADQFQTYFDNGKTVLKTVFSFDLDYLKDRGLVDPDFELREAGDQRGHVDQLKLRMGLMKALNDMGKRYYDDFKFVGAVHVNTNHVHCHFAMVDAGEGTVMPDGTQRGKLFQRAMKGVRRSLNQYLDQKKHVRSLSQMAALKRQTAVCYVKNLTHRSFLEQDRYLIQLLVSALPQDPSLWRANSNRKEMRRPNRLVRNYVERLFMRPDSGYASVLASIQAYAIEKGKRDRLSIKEQEKLIKKGKSDLIDKCINSVYAMIRQRGLEDLKPVDRLTKMISIPYESAASTVRDNLFENLCFKARSYGGRLKYHKQKYQAIQKERQEIRRLDDISKDAQPLVQFLDLEQRYQAMCLTKYQYLFPDLLDDRIYDELEEILKYERDLESLKQMRADKSLARMDPQNAERYGMQVYGQYGGRHLRKQVWRIDNRIEKMSENLDRRRDAFADKLFSHGYIYSPEQGIVKHRAYDFNDIRFVDIHHMGYDCRSDRKLTMTDVRVFVNLAKQRYASFLGAKDYLVRSGQVDRFDLLNESDVLLMKAHADKLAQTHILESKRKELTDIPDVMAVSIDRHFSQNVDLAIRSAVLTADDLSLG